MDMKKVIARLESVYREKPHRVFSMYLNTDPSNPEQQVGDWKIHLKNGLNNFESYLNADGDQEEKKNFNKINEKVQQYIQENELNLSKSIVIFATADEEVWFAERFQMPVETCFYWQETAKVDQLSEMYHQFPKTGIILIQKERIKIIDSVLGSVSNTKQFALDLITEKWKELSGPQDELEAVEFSGYNMRTDKLEQRFEANRSRLYKTFASKLDKLAKDKQWDSIYLVGDKKEAQDLMANMNKPVTDIVCKNMLDHEETKVIDVVMA
ncbi:VLRF1 family aeRF1-type release factor [Paucisalibacillus globulus]|uniref:VLRF1 family aeRF1-type release factor n=1 Tax=Paucisalibacillus globulus TaxID=351095 RepID=UPI000403A87B|nr:VLRF1 family aeRF1-type release factor [Paucisalibacillus globulus]